MRNGDEQLRPFFCNAAVICSRGAGSPDDSMREHARMAREIVYER
jgi:hypothetical protein